MTSPLNISAMWRAGVDVKSSSNGADDDDWETEADFEVNCDKQSFIEKLYICC